MYNKGDITMPNNQLEPIIEIVTFFAEIMSMLLTTFAKLILCHLPKSEVL